jgi:hypothetical protein
MVIAAWNARPKINDAAPRFHIDHGVIHDRFTGKHVTTDEDSAFCDGIVAACALLNELNAGRQPFDDERERKAAWKAGAECGISESDMFGWVNGWLAARSDEAER